MTFYIISSLYGNYFLGRPFKACSSNPIEISAICHQQLASLAIASFVSDLFLTS